jgi:hypothetical protein
MDDAFDPLQRQMPVGFRADVPIGNPLLASLLPLHAQPATSNHPNAPLLEGGTDRLAQEAIGARHQHGARHLLRFLDREIGHNCISQ